MDHMFDPLDGVLEGSRLGHVWHDDMFDVRSLLACSLECLLQRREFGFTSNGKSDLPSFVDQLLQDAKADQA